MITCLPASRAAIATSACRPVGVRCEGLAAPLGSERLGPLGHDVNHGDQLHPIGQFADDAAMVPADHAHADEGDAGGLGGLTSRCAHAYSIPSLVSRSVKAFQACVKSSGPE